jgi:hypothetical protein
MAKRFSILLNKSKLPDREALQAQIKQLGFKLTLEEEIPLFCVPKYLPCTLNGEDAGFTLNVAANQAQPNMDAVAMIQWGGDPREKAAAAMVACAFAFTTDCLILDSENNPQSRESLKSLSQKALASLDD